MISGATGVGKSETLRSMRPTLIDIVGEIAVLETDQFYMMIDPQWTCPPGRIERYYAVAGHLLRETALGFLRSGFAWVAIASNGHWKEQRARDFVQPFHREDTYVHHFTLDPGKDVLRQRCSAPVDMLLQVRHELGPWTHVIDNSQLTPKATVQAIHAAIEQAAG
jgi:hypothetical protein